MRKHRGIFVSGLIILLILAADVFLLQGVERRAMYQGEEIFPNFATTDLDGVVVTGDIFAGKLTVVCLWVTTDSASRELLKKLAAWQKDSSEKVQLLGLVGDLPMGADSEQIALAKDMVADCPRGFRQLKVNDSFGDFLSRVRAAPTVCFVNEKGCIVGQPVVGSELALIEKEVSRLLDRDSPRTRSLELIQQFLWR